jgi:hypothetical protein
VAGDAHLVVLEALGRRQRGRGRRQQPRDGDGAPC